MNSSPIAYYSTFATPLGKFSVAVDDRRAVIATAFGGREALAARMGRRLARASGSAGKPTTRRNAAATSGERSVRFVRDLRRTAPARAQIEAYFLSGRHEFTLPVAPAGTPFQQRAWSALRRIPFGQTRSYGDIARELRSSARAVGRANATNPVCLVVPCHRVIGADGSLTGYAFGEAIKRRLLAHEGRPQTPRSSPDP